MKFFRYFFFFNKRDSFPTHNLELNLNSAIPGRPSRSECNSPPLASPRSTPQTRYCKVKVIVCESLIHLLMSLNLDFLTDFPPTVPHGTLCNIRYMEVRHPPWISFLIHENNLKGENIKKRTSTGASTRHTTICRCRINPLDVEHGRHSETRRFCGVRESSC